MKYHDVSKRGFLKTTAYVAPAIFTLTVAPSFAAAGSGSYPVVPKSKPGSGFSGIGEIRLVRRRKAKKRRAK
ncbi:MAG: hypothetical protein L0Z46_08295 [Nitrospiraceae bacterium]|nr:hypothetical protein [Nitrospiraceae bacterium]